MATLPTSHPPSGHHRWVKQAQRCVLGLIAGLGLMAAPAQAVMHALDPVPGATVLVPYFEVDLNNPNGQTTIVTVVNASATAVLVNAVIWSDYGRPLKNFNFYLTGFDVAPINMRDVLNGQLPVTASAGQDPAGNISRKGPLSQDINFASCTGILGSVAGTTFNTATVNDLKAALTGLAATSTSLRGVNIGDCAGKAFGDNMARGYLTFDIVSACEDIKHSDVGYTDVNTFSITSQNTLWADTLFVNPSANTAYGDLAVMIESDTFSGTAFSSGDYTFYGRFNGATAVDKREALPTTWSVQADRDNADVQVWRDARTAITPTGVGVACAATPSGFPISHESAGAFFYEGSADPITTAFLFGNTASGQIRMSNAATGLNQPGKLAYYHLNLKSTITGGVNFRDVSLAVPAVDANLTQSHVFAVRAPKYNTWRTGSTAFPMDNVRKQLFSFPTYTRRADTQ
jgi:hypothetical protein